MTWLTHAPMAHPTFHRAAWHDASWTHQRVMALFGDLGGSPGAREAGGILYRVEPEIAGGRVLIQSQVEPVAGGLHARRLDVVLDQLTMGREVRFLLAANAVRTINRTADGKVASHRARVFDHERDAWLKERLDGAIDVISLAPPDERKLRNRRAQLIVTTFRGKGVVADGRTLHRLCVEGVGRAKAYGCGLLSVLPA